METVFIETNAINSCFDEGISGQELNSILQKKKLTPIVSQHSTYELARTFVDHNTREKGKKLFNILFDLNPIYSCETKELLKRELTHLENKNKSIDYLMEPSIKSKLDEALHNICNDNIKSDYFKFINEREIAFDSDKKLFEKLYGNKNEPNFDAFITKIINNRNIIKIIHEFTDINLNIIQSEKLISSISCYKAIYAAIRANTYLNYLAINNKKIPKKDRTYDYHHLIDSVYCGYFVTDDRKLTKAAPFISSIEIISFSELLNF
ncbi:hypothetical protein Lqui_2191 [Legionella quinlivanii]|uniref:Uncharacterized protein n=3 Tax=Legionella quinlivanii TaxID=45073 RepID=A0A0W0XT19_9GAMM|nr:hypothetical protein [Legionella quinlivanii]KTD47927.1 hypothetical protein Lqui_2191 [Legionella quinlivanii]SEG19157.1 hypothetical protein SAMN02746093_02115 [Legionella quinlivanii DSM 21216]STY11037.1 Uncharacterised protein [Legionella quinlivanii]